MIDPVSPPKVRNSGTSAAYFMTQQFLKSNALDRVKGRLCFSSNYNAVIFVHESGSDTRELNWDIIADTAIFAEFSQAFTVRPTHVENSYYVQADYEKLSDWLAHKNACDNDRSAGDQHKWQADGEASLTGETKNDDLIDIASAADIPDEWKHTPIESLIMAVNFNKFSSQRVQQKIGLISCETHLSGWFRRLHDFDLCEVPKSAMRDTAMRPLLTSFTSRGIQQAVVIGHSSCAMRTNSREAHEIFEALLSQGWSAAAAQEYLAPRFPIFDEVKSLRSDYDLLRRLFKSVQFAPLFVCQYTQTLKLPAWYLGERGVDAGEVSYSQP